MRLRNEFRIAQPGDGVLLVTGGAIQFDLHFSQSDALAAICSLQGQDVSAEDISGRLQDANRPEVFAEWLYAIGSLHNAAALEYPTARDDIVIVPHSAYWEPRVEGSFGAVELSRFAVIRPDCGCLVVESPLAFARVEIRSTTAISALTEIATPGPDSVSDVASSLIRALRSAGLLSDGDDAPFESWSVADAAMHARSRIGRGQGPERRERKPRTHEPFRPVVQEWIPLTVHRPRTEIRALDDVLSARRSRRSCADTPISLDALSELLARSSREEKRVLPNGQESVGRLYPSGGNCHSLDLYVAVAKCEGLDPALYLYDRHAHALGRVTGAGVALTLVRDAREAAFQNDEGQVLIILASDFDAVMSQYDGIAYSLILKEVGAALQTVHLVATEMNLAACPIGTGDSALLARVLGADFFQYTSVGEMLIGSAGTEPRT